MARPAPRPTIDASLLPRADEGLVAEQLVSLVSPTSFAADQYRSLRHSVERLRMESGVRILAVTSATPGEGKTVTTLNLAGAIAQGQGRRVLVIDADLRRPAVARYLGLESHHLRGLGDAIQDPTCDLTRSVRYLERFNLSVLVAGAPHPAPYELLNSPRLDTLLGEASEHYDQVLIDTPPLISLPDCRLIGKWAHGFLVVVAAHKTPRKLVGEALGLLEPAKVVGLVFNGARPTSDNYGYYRDYYANGRRAWWRRTNGR
jgi:protein-tyrosine kinase